MVVSPLIALGILRKHPLDVSPDSGVSGKAWLMTWNRGTTAIIFD